MIEFCIVSLINHVLEAAQDYTFVIDGQTINYNSTPKILGNTVDKKLRFEKHIEYVKKKAILPLDSLMKVKETESIISNCMLQFIRH